MARGLGMGAYSPRSKPMGSQHFEQNTTPQKYLEINSAPQKYCIYIPKIMSFR